MIQQNEIVMLFLGVGVWVFTVRNRAGLSRLPASMIILAAFYVLLGSCVVTVLEGFFWNTFFNLLEHAGLAMSSVFTAIWCWKVFLVSKEPR